MAAVVFEVGIASAVRWSKSTRMGGGQGLWRRMGTGGLCSRPSRLAAGAAAERELLPLNLACGVGKTHDGVNQRRQDHHLQDRNEADAGERYERHSLIGPASARERPYLDDDRDAYAEQDRTPNLAGGHSPIPRRITPQQCYRSVDRSNDDQIADCGNKADPEMPCESGIAAEQERLRILLNKVERESRQQADDKRSERHARASLSCRVFTAA